MGPPSSWPADPSESRAAAVLGGPVARGPAPRVRLHSGLSADDPFAVVCRRSTWGRRAGRESREMGNLFGRYLRKRKYGDDVVIVSGLPRSGTSMMMKMLDAGGIAVMT